MKPVGRNLCALARTRTDPGAFGAFYQQESEKVLVFFVRRTFDAELALDLTAETFAEAWRSCRSFRGSTDAEARAWLFTIGRRQMARYLQRGAVERKAIAALELRVPLMHEDDLAAVEERAGLAELRLALADELARLGDDQRQALTLRIVDERSYEEIAAALGVSEDTVRARVSRGLRALGRALELRASAEVGS